MTSPTVKSEEEFEKLLARIDQGVERVKAEKTPDAKDIKELVANEVAKAEVGLANEWLLVGLRKRYGHNIILFLWVYFAFTASAIVGSSLGYVVIVDSVLVALIGGTAVSVLGVVGTVAAGLFKPPPPPAKDK